MAGYRAVIPQITGSAYVTGFSTYVIVPDDPLKYGFKAARENDNVNACSCKSSDDYL